MKTAFALLISFVSFNAFADQAATWSCAGNSVTINSVQSYLGDYSTDMQTLYTITEDLGLSLTPSAFFLNVSITKNSYTSVVIVGSNEQGGAFQLNISNIQDVSDGTIIQEIGQGVLSYAHGPMRGSRLRVDCARE